MFSQRISRQISRSSKSLSTSSPDKIGLVSFLLVSLFSVLLDSRFKNSGVPILGSPVFSLWEVRRSQFGKRVKSFTQIMLGLQSLWFFRSISPNVSNSLNKRHAFVLPQRSPFFKVSILKYTQTLLFSSIHPFSLDKLIRSNNSPYKTFASHDTALNLSVKRYLGIL